MNLPLQAREGPTMRGRIRPPIRHQDESEELNLQRLQRRLQAILEEATRLAEQVHLAQLKACYFGYATKRGRNFRIIASRIASELQNVQRDMLQVKTHLFTKGVAASPETVHEGEGAFHLNAYESEWFWKLKTLAGESPTVERHDLRLALPERAFDFGSIFKVLRALAWYGLDIAFAQRKDEPLRRLFNEIDQFPDPTNEETKHGFETIEYFRSFLQERILSASDLNSRTRAALSTAISEHVSLFPLVDEVQRLERRFAGLSLRGQTAGLEKLLSEVRSIRRSFTEEVATTLVNSSTATDDDFALQIKSTLDRIAESKAAVIRSHLNVSVVIASSYSGRGVEIADLVQEACIGLLDAVERYDCKGETTFRGYSAFWVQQRILKAIANQSRLIRFPVYVHEKVVKASADEQIETDASFESVKSPTPAVAENEILRLSTIREKDLYGIGHYCDGESQLDTATVGDLEEVVSDVLDTLEQREKCIIKLRFGFDGRSPLTLEELGSKYGITRERIRQIESTALKKLRHPVRAKVLARAR